MASLVVGHVFAVHASCILFPPLVCCPLIATTSPPISTLKKWHVFPCVILTHLSALFTWGYTVLIIFKPCPRSPYSHGFVRCLLNPPSALYSVPVVSSRFLLHLYWCAMLLPHTILDSNTSCCTSMRILNVVMRCSLLAYRMGEQYLPRIKWDCKWHSRDKYWFTSMFLVCLPQGQA